MLIAIRSRNLTGSTYEPRRRYAPWTRDQPAHVVLALAAERALQRAAAGTAPSGTGRVVGLEEITASTIRYSFACSAVMKKSRSVSCWIFSMDCPVWWT